MRKFFLFCFLHCSAILYGQHPCSDSLHRQFDFWVGDWEVYGKNGQKAGESQVSIILDSCIILEEWTSASLNRGIRYAGKSFNTYNRSTGQWQQTWVDNVGGTTEFLKGGFADNMMRFETLPYQVSADTFAIRRLSFFHLGPDRLRQLGEISRDGKGTWTTEYDLEYRRRKKPS